MLPITSHTSTAPVQPATLRQNMEGYLQAIDQHLEAHAQLPSWQSIDGDSEAIKALVELANVKYPGLNLYTLIDGDANFGERIRQLLDQGLSAFRLIVRPVDYTHHSIAFDVRCLDGKTSVIGLESATTRGFGAALLAAQCVSSTQRWLPEAAVTVLETDLQRSCGDCMMFSLALSKKVFTNEQAMTELHQQNLLRQLPETGSGSVYQHLPPELMKHAHSSQRLQDYMAHNPAHAGQRVNKRGMQLLERQWQFLGPLRLEDDRVVTCSNSIDHKRRSEIAALLTHLEMKG